MSSEKKNQEKSRLHIRNKNRERYDLNSLVKATPELKAHVVPNKHGAESIDFSNRQAVRLLNTAILKYYYGIKSWDFPNENLCPPIPGRADYIHYMADLLTESNFGKTPRGPHVVGLDIGVGASCIYPIIGTTEYDWSFIGSDTDKESIASAQKIIESNTSLRGKVECRLQKDPTDIFYGILDRNDKIDFSMCNPPFHSSKEEAIEGTRRKIKNLTGKKLENPERNFAGINNELVYTGGEYRFIQNMVRESRKYSSNCFWFSTLVSKQSNLRKVHGLLEKTDASQIKTIRMGTGNKSSRLVAWSFLKKNERLEWRETRWKKDDGKTTADS